jgi:hypothetical protein
MIARKSLVVNRKSLHGFRNDLTDPGRQSQNLTALPLENQAISRLLAPAISDSRFPIPELRCPIHDSRLTNALDQDRQAEPATRTDSGGKTDEVLA